MHRIKLTSFRMEAMGSKIASGGLWWLGLQIISLDTKHQNLLC